MSSIWTGRRPAQSKLRRGFVPSLEVLENRLTPTGIVTGIINTKGDLILTGDIHENDISLTMTGDVLTVTGNNGTTLSGVGFKGDTTRDFEDFKNVIIDLKSDDDTIEITECTFPANVTVSGSAGKDTFTVGAAGGSLVVGGSLNILGGTGDDTITVTEVEVDDNLIINGGNGANVVTCEGDDPAFINVFGHFSYTGGGGKDTITSSLTVKTALTFDLGQGINSATLNEADIYGSCTIVGGNTHDTIAVTATNVGGNTSLNLKNGNNATTIEGGVYEGNFTVLSGIHKDTVGLSENIVIGGNTLLSGGSNQDAFTIDTCEFFGDLKITSGTEVSITGCLIEDDLEITLGSFGDTVDVSTTSVEGDLLVNTSVGEDTLTLTTLDVGGVTNIQTSFGDDTVTLDGGEYGLAVLINTGNGNDNLALASGADINFNDIVTINMGVNDDTLDLGSGGSVNLLGAICNFHGSSGTDTLITGTIVGDFAPTGFE